MKKLFALMLALCLVLCSAAMAETAATEEAEVTTTVVALDKIGLNMIMFSNFAEDPDAQPQDGAELLYAWKATDGSSDYIRIEAQKLEITTAEDFLTAAQGSGFADAQILELDNGARPVVFTNTEGNEVCAALVSEDGTVLGFSVGPAAGQEESAGLVMGALLGSLSPIE